MIRRITVALALVGASLAPAAAHAQFAAPGQPVYSPASYGEHQHAHGGDNCPMCQMSATAQPQGLHPITPAYYQPSPYYQEAYDDLSGDDGWDYGSSPFDAFLLSAASGVYFRLEYLNWTYKDPGDQALGAGILSEPEPREFFDVTVAGQFAGRARVATLSDVDLGHRNGIRSTLGMSLPGGSGSLETTIFWMQDRPERTEEFELGAPAVGTNDPPLFIATSTLTNGQPGNNLFFYDDTFRTKFSSDLWGGEINWIADSLAPANGLQIRPIVGFRYVDIKEQLVQTGSFNQQGALVVPLVSVITSQSYNTVYVPQVGARVELSHPRFTIGVEPKIGFGVIDINNTVVTERLRSQGDPTITSHDESAKITAVGEIALYGKIRVTENMVINAGYSFMFVDNVSRAHNSIFYNDNGPANDAAIVARQSHELMYYQGINVGAEFRY